MMLLQDFPYIIKEHNRIIFVDPQTSFKLSIEEVNMSSVVSKKHPNSSEPEKNAEDQGEISHQPSRGVTTHLYLKPAAQSAGTLDKEVVLRRIRHRRRVNKVKKAVQVFLSSPFPAESKNIDNNKAAAAAAPPTIKWADDAFAAP